ncbi:MAG: hypothetical protein HQ521_06065 [Bacteroidetes bacterium]|nr:hypothetical protein [Bacteroidota bacterium]
MKFIVTVFMLVIYAAALLGWIQNITKLVDSDFEAPYKTEVIRTISIIPPIGAVTGWMTIGEEK